MPNATVTFRKQNMGSICGPDDTPLVFDSLGQLNFSFEQNDAWYFLYSLEFLKHPDYFFFYHYQIKKGCLNRYTILAKPRHTLSVLLVNPTGRAYGPGNLVLSWNGSNRFGPEERIAASVLASVALDTVPLGFSGFIRLPVPPEEPVKLIFSENNTVRAGQEFKSGREEVSYVKLEI